MDGQANYAVQIEETHHLQKLDAPSGTAITLARDLHMPHPTDTLAGN
jgi:4-hydroxy-tetrahydrodipicolinate reductase